MSNELNIHSIEEAEELIAQAEAKKQEVYTEIGKQYFLRHSADCEPDFKPYIDAGRLLRRDRRAEPTDPCDEERSELSGLRRGGQGGQPFLYRMRRSPERRACGRRTRSRT